MCEALYRHNMIPLEDNMELHVARRVNHQKTMKINHDSSMWHVLEMK